MHYVVALVVIQAYTKLSQFTQTTVKPVVAMVSSFAASISLLTLLAWSETLEYDCGANHVFKCDTYTDNHPCNLRVSRKSQEMNKVVPSGQ